MRGEIVASELQSVKKALQDRGLPQLEVSEHQGAVLLEGEVASWDDYLAAGYAAVGHGFRGVVNDITVPGIQISTSSEKQPVVTDLSLANSVFDVVIIGGGIIGCAIARELTRWSLKVALLEKEDDVAKHTSSRNNGMIHPAMTVKLGSKKHYYNLKGNRMYDQVARELGFELEWPGSLALLTKGWQLLLGPLAKRSARKKGLQGVKIFSRKRVKELEPNVGDEQHGAIYMPESGVVAPYKVTVAYAENAIQNGASLFMNTVVQGIEKEGNRIVGVRTNRGIIQAGLVINAAGIWSDRIAQMAGDRFFTIHPRKGVIAILDKKTHASQKMIFGRIQLSGKAHTKGGGLTLLIDGNILAGPNATETPDREDYSTYPEDLQFLVENHLPLNRTLNKEDIITYFAGTRACTFEEDFIVEASEYVENLVHAAGIQSPGLASAPAIAVDVADIAVGILKKKIELKMNPAFNPVRREAPNPAKMKIEERNRLIASNPSYGKIICRCEMVSEGEIADAIHSTLPARSVDAVKRRARAGMGRCQGGFCTPAVLNIIAREIDADITEICKREPGSEMILGRTKGKARKSYEN